MFDVIPEAPNEQPVPPASNTLSDTELSPPSQTPIRDTSPPLAVYSGGSGSSGRKLLMLVFAIIILAVLAVVAYSLKPHNKQTPLVKKDIPYLTYGFSGTGDVGQTYPTETSDDTNTSLINGQLFEGLVRYEDQTKVVPWLATGWTNPDDTTWIFNLRHGVKFHSGRTMTAADVAYSLNYAVAHEGISGSATNLSLASTIKEVKAVQPYQVEITTDGPDAVLLSRLASLYVVDSEAKLGSPNAGTGPYTVASDTINPKATSIDLAAFNGYWAGHVYTRQVHIQEDATPQQMASDVISGKLDVAGDFPAQQITQIKSKTKYYQSIAIPDLGVSFLNLNTERANSPLHSLAARQAITYALDIPAILKSGGLNGIQASQIIPPALPGHDPSLVATPYNPIKAKQLLTNVPNLSTPLTLSYPTGDEGQVGAIAKELAAVGFTIKLVQVGDVGTLASTMIAGQGDIFYLGFGSDTLDGLDMVENIVAAGSNLYDSPELNGLIKQAGSTLDPSTRIATLQKMERVVAADIPTVSLYDETRNYTLTKPYILNTDFPSADTGTYFSQVYQK